MIQIHSGATSRPQDFVARSVATRPHALKLARVCLCDLNYQDRRTLIRKAYIKLTVKKTANCLYCYILYVNSLKL